MPGRFKYALWQRLTAGVAPIAPFFIQQRAQNSAHQAEAERNSRYHGVPQPVAIKMPKSWRKFWKSITHRTYADAGLFPYLAVFAFASFYRDVAVHVKSVPVNSWRRCGQRSSVRVLRPARVGQALVNERKLQRERHRVARS